MNTEITNITDDSAVRGWVCYDGGCPMCAATVRRFDATLARRGFRCVAIETRWVAKRLGLREGERAERMALVLNDEHILQGADAVVHLARRIWWAWPIALLAALPGGRRLLHSVYDWVARHRGCTDVGCSMTASKGAARDHVRPSPRQASRWLTWAPLFVLPAVAIAIGRSWPPWLWMWLIAVAIFAACKWLTWREAMADCSAGGCITRPTTARSLGYLFGWPGMDAAAFLHKSEPPPRPARGEWCSAILKTLLGAALLWGAARCVPPDMPLAAGWVGMIGVIMLLHFGSFHLLSLGWRGLGIHALPLMRGPIAATSLSEFWSRRWNRAFHQLAGRLVFRPLHRRFSAAIALLTAFVCSGLVHELVISLPAGAGYGLPTAYFALQGVGLLLERSRIGQRVGLRRGWRGWLFVVVITALPAYWLFHPAFVLNVVVPFLRAVGAIG